MGDFVYYLGKIGVVKSKRKDISMLMCVHLPRRGQKWHIPIHVVFARNLNKFNTYDIQTKICRYRNNAGTRSSYPSFLGYFWGSLSPVCSSVISRNPSDTCFVAGRRA